MNNEQANKIIDRIAQEMETCKPVKLQGDEINAIHAAVRDGGHIAMLRKLREMAERGGIHARRAFAIAQCARQKANSMINSVPDSNRPKWYALRDKFARVAVVSEAIIYGIPASRAFWEKIDISECERHKIRAILSDYGLQRISTASYSCRDYHGIDCVFAPRKQAIRFYTGQRINSDFSRCEYWQ